MGEGTLELENVDEESPEYRGVAWRVWQFSPGAAVLNMHVCRKGSTRGGECEEWLGSLDLGRVYQRGTYQTLLEYTRGWSAASDAPLTLPWPGQGDGVLLYRIVGDLEYLVQLDPCSGDWYESLPGDLFFNRAAAKLVEGGRGATGISDVPPSTPGTSLGGSVECVFRYRHLPSSVIPETPVYGRFEELRQAAGGEAKDVEEVCQRVHPPPHDGALPEDTVPSGCAVCSPDFSPQPFMRYDPVILAGDDEAPRAAQEMIRQAESHQDRLRAEEIRALHPWAEALPHTTPDYRPLPVQLPAGLEELVELDEQKDEIERRLLRKRRQRKKDKHLMLELCDCAVLPYTTWVLICWDMLGLK